MRNSLNIIVVYVSVMALIISQTIPAYAGIIGTEQIMVQQVVNQDREILHTILDRDEARNILEQNGVSTEQAQERIDAMTNKEVRIIAQKFEELPAAGSIGGAAALLILILLLIALAISR